MHVCGLVMKEIPYETLHTPVSSHRGVITSGISETVYFTVQAAVSQYHRVYTVLQDKWMYSIHPFSSFYIVIAGLLFYSLMYEHYFRDVQRILLQKALILILYHQLYYLFKYFNNQYIPLRNNFNISTRVCSTLILIIL